jgi:hypothetical protein
MGWHPGCYFHGVGGRQDPGDQMAGLLSKDSANAYGISQNT